MQAGMMMNRLRETTMRTPSRDGQAGWDERQALQARTMSRFLQSTRMRTGAPDQKTDGWGTGDPPDAMLWGEDA